MAQATTEIEIRVSMWRWRTFLVIDWLLRLVGIRLSARTVAWVASRSVQARINGVWETVPLIAEEVLEDASR